MTDYFASENNGNTMKIEAFGKSCEFRPYLSVDDLEIVSHWTQETISSVGYRNLTAKLIANHTHKVFSADEISQLDDSVFREYIGLCIEEDEKLKEKYSKQNSEDVFENFIIAIQQREQEYLAPVSKAYNEIMLPALKQVTIPKINLPIIIPKQNFPVTIPKVNLPDISASISKITQASQNLQSMMSSIQFTWLENLPKITASLKLNLPDYSKAFGGMTSAIQELLKGITIPTISEERKQQLIESYTEWGKLGWTMPPDAKPNEFNKPPENSTAAYNQLRYCTTNSCMEKIFNELSEMPNLKKSDLREAIECYRNKHYKSSCLIIFSMIDSRLIRSQVDSERDRNGFRRSGKQAANNLFGRIKTNIINDQMIFTMLDQVNLLEALKTFFDNGNDFKVQPHVLNRNFLDHGMLYRKVIRKDCVMLFILLFNLTQFLNDFSI